MDSTTIRRAVAVGGIAVGLSLSAGIGSATAQRLPEPPSGSSAGLDLESQRWQARADAHARQQLEEFRLVQRTRLPGEDVSPVAPEPPAIRIPSPVEPTGIPTWAYQTIGTLAAAGALGAVVVAASRRRHHAAAA